MGQDKVSSFLLSLCIHLCLLALVLWWPSSRVKPKELVQVIQVSEFVTLGAPGKRGTDSGRKQETVSMSPSRKEKNVTAEPKLAGSVEMQKQTAVEEKKPASDSTASLNREEAKLTPSRQSIPDVSAATEVKTSSIQKNEPASKEEVQPLPEKTLEPVLEKKTTVTPKLEEATPTSEKKLTQKKKPEPVTTTDIKPAPEEKPKAETSAKKDVKNDKTKKEQSKDLKKKENNTVNGKNVKKTTAKDTKSGSKPEKATKKEVKSSKTSSEKGTSSGKANASKLDDVLSRIGSQVEQEEQNVVGGGGSGDDEVGEGPGGFGGTGIGDLGPYEHVIEQSVKRNIKLPKRADRRVLWAKVLIILDGEGNLIEWSIIDSSGDAEYNDGMIGALRRTEFIEEAPPRDRLRNGKFTVEITFKPDE